ncbi:MAG: hypothetical protein ABIS36_10945 [Chryseolinea sp.]
MNVVRTPITSLRLKDLANLYKLCKTTMRKRLVPLQDLIGPRHGHYYAPMQVAIIFDDLGNPGLLVWAVRR